MNDRGERIQAARIAAGLSQAELARRAGTSQPAVNRYEQGRTVPTVRTMERIVGACQERMRPSELLANNRERVWRLAVAHGAQRVLVFGSVARGEDDAESDLDLIVEIPPDRLRLLDLIELGHEISDVLGVEVDIGTPEMLKRSIRNQVLNDIPRLREGRASQRLLHARHRAKNQLRRAAPSTRGGLRRTRPRLYRRPGGHDHPQQPRGDQHQRLGHRLT
ncbi:MAG: helix-turn-helix domain-containing protein [Acidimicrobiales bacterium]